MELEAVEAPCPPDGEPRREKKDIPPGGPPLDASGVVPCPNHGMDHLTRDPSCEFCKKALGPLFWHLKGKCGIRLDDQTPTLSFDFSGPSQFGMSVPQNTLITSSHNRRFDWEMFSGNLMIEALNADPEVKPVIHHKAPSVFVWPENQAWNCMERIAPRLELSVPEPWSNPEFAEIAESALQPLSTKVKDNQSAFNNWIWTWAYEDPDKQGDPNRIPDKYPLGVFFTILWMAGLWNASVKQNVPVERLFSDHDRSDLRKGG